MIDKPLALFATMPVTDTLGSPTLAKLCVFGSNGMCLQRHALGVGHVVEQLVRCHSKTQVVERASCVKEKLLHTVRSIDVVRPAPCAVGLNHSAHCDQCHVLRWFVNGVQHRQKLGAALLFHCNTAVVADRVCYTFAFRAQLGCFLCNIHVPFDNSWRKQSCLARCVCGAGRLLCIWQ